MKRGEEHEEGKGLEKIIYNHFFFISPFFFFVFFVLFVCFVSSFQGSPKSSGGTP